MVEDTRAILECAYVERENLFANGGEEEAKEEEKGKRWRKTRKEKR